MHRLVQAVTIAQMPAELAVAWRQAAAAVIEAALPADPRSPGDLAIVCPAAAARPGCPGDDSGSMWKIISYLGHSGNYPAARDLQQRVAPDTGTGVSAPSTRTR